MATQLIKKTNESTKSGSQVPMEIVQKWNRKQMYNKGFTQGVSVGPNADINLALGGKARWLYGLTIFLPSASLTNDDTFSLNINSELIIEKCNWKSFYPGSTGNFKNEPYFPLPRPLFGTDSVSLSWTAVAAINVYLIFYLSDVRPKEFTDMFPNM